MFCMFLLIRICSTPPKKVFSGTTMGKKQYSIFRVIPVIAPRILFLFFILHYSLVFDCKFIWKSYVDFSVIEFTFVMAKDT